MIGFERASAPRWVLVAILTLLALWVTMGVTLTLTLGNAQPRIALAAWPWGAASLARKAADATQAGTVSGPASALVHADAERALRAEPGNVIALRSLGIAAASVGQEATLRYFASAERFSRRDLTVQMALIETEVARGNVQAAIAHYDRALRTSYRAYDVLFPVLIAASHDPMIARQLAPRLAVRPAWWNAFVERAIQDPAANPNLAWLVRQVRLRASKPDERLFLIGAMQRLVAQGDLAGASRLYRDVRGDAMAGRLLRDGGFERDDQLPPFEWLLTDTTDLAAVREPGGGTMRLRLVADGSDDGVLAQQLLMLRPGGYRVTMRFGDAQPGVFSLRLACIDGRMSPLSDQAIAGGVGGRGRLDIRLVVPATQCPAQWLTIVAHGQSDPGSNAGTQAWIDDMAIVGPTS